MNQLKDHLKGGTQQSVFARISDGERVCKYQRGIYQKAKQEKDFRFYRLYDKIYLPYFLREAWKHVKSNGGAAGIDKMEIADIEKQGEERFLKEIEAELKNKTYRPQGVRRVWIEKANGKKRPLGIPTVKDRVVQQSCKMVIEPIFEADFSENSFGFRPNKSAQEAIKAIKTNVTAGRTDIYDADLSSYFDTIPHDKLMKALEERISDHNVLRIIKSWLKAPIHENGKISGGKSTKTGTPQGGVISPLLANIYLNLLDRNVERQGSIFDKAGIKIVRYADDFVLMGKEITEEAKAKIKQILEKLGLTINEDKTRHLKATNKGGFDFIGFNIRYDKSQYNKGQKYWNIHPSKQSEKKFRAKIKEFLSTKLARPIQEVIKGLNEKIQGHYNYYFISKVSYLRNETLRFRNYLEMKLYRYTQRKSQRVCKRYGYNVYEHLKDHLGLLDINTIANPKGSL